MKKSILNLGKLLNKVEQKLINGGDGSIFSDKGSCQYHCRNLYGINGVCCVANDFQWMCDNFEGQYGC
ncbi:hypothetical protein [Tenacibaculum discolor]|uniref:hypothetical protein n=1 Tax=Tenacibaculum discolor TaxID=361581 RepID=UPI003F7A3528